jgi:hypothetical protein
MLASDMLETSILSDWFSRSAISCRQGSEVDIHSSKDRSSCACEAHLSCRDAVTTWRRMSRDMPSLQAALFIAMFAEINLVSHSCIEVILAYLAKGRKTHCQVGCVLPH